MNIALQNATILVTGCAGFIGSAVCKKLLERNLKVIGIDNLNDYYDPHLKLARLAPLQSFKNFEFHHFDLVDKNKLEEIFQKQPIDYVIHLAAQAGVRFSQECPDVYIQSNLVGFANILECCRYGGIKHLVFASSSSVYGNNDKYPYSVRDNVDCPISLYAATKKSNELMAYSYSHLYGFAATGLRYFTVYGPWGRPDMAPIKFARQLIQEQPIQVYNHGHHERDFTYIEDIVAGTISILEHVPPKKAGVAYEIFNIGYGKPVQLLYFIELLAKALQKEARLVFFEKQPGDVDKTWADITELKQNINYTPQVSIETGIKLFAEWFLKHYQLLL